MFKLNEKYEISRNILNCDYIRSSSAETSTINTPNSQKHIIIPWKDSDTSLLKSYLDLNFEVNKKADNSRYANGNDIRLVNLRPIASFSNFRLTTSSGKHLEDIIPAQIVSLMYKLTSGATDTNDLSTGFDHSRNRRRDELTSDKNIKSKYHLRIMLKDVFVFAEHQEKATYGLSYKLTITRIKDDAVIDKPACIADARNKIDQIPWFLPHYTPCIQQQGTLSKQILS